MRKTLAERLFDRIEIGPIPKKCPKFGPCWLWTGRKCDGYGRTLVNGSEIGAHRAMYQVHKGVLPSYLDLHHLCEIRHCCNPGHLEPKDRKDHLSLHKHHNREKTHCVKGHPLSGDNLRPSALERGERVCKQCAAEASRVARKNKANLPFLAVDVFLACAT